MPTEDPKSNDNKDKVHRLVDLLVHEVSLVDHGANRHKWLIRKREDNMKGKRVTIGNDGSLTTTKSDPFGVSDATNNTTDDDTKEDENRDDTNKTVKIAKSAKESVSTVVSSAKESIGVIVDAVKSAEEIEDKGTVIPAVISGPIRSVSSSIFGLVGEYPTQKAVSPDVHVIKVEEDDKTIFRVEGVDTGVLFGEYSTQKEANDRADAVAAFKPIITKSDASEDRAQKARKLLWMVMDKVNDGAFMDEGEKSLVDAMLGMLKEAVAKQAEELGQIVLAPTAKRDITETLNNILGKIDSFSEEIEKAEETEDELPAPMPDSLGLELAKIAHMMISLVTKYSTPEDDRNNDQSVGEDVAKLLATVIDKLNADKSNEEPVIQLLEKAVGMLGKSQPADDKKSNEKKPSQKEQDVDKRGAKLSAARRAKFREAMKILSELFTELVPDEGKGGWPPRKTTKSAKIEIKKSEDEHIKLEKKQEEIQAKIEKSKAELCKVRKELAEEKKRAQPSNTAWVDQVPDSEDFNSVDKSKKVSWPSDLNAPEDW